MNVSAVVPIFNSVNTLERAIKSLLIQPEINEIFIVDDGSTDTSFDLSLELEKSNSFIKVLTHEGRVNKGASAARNLGLKYCSNEWIQFLDADDELLSGKIKNQFLLINSNTSLVQGYSLWKNSKRVKKVGVDKDVLNGLLCGFCGNTCSNLWNKNVLMQVGLWNEELINTQENELMFRIYLNNKNFAIDTEYSTLIHEVPNSLTRNKEKKKKHLMNQYTLRRAILTYIKSNVKFFFPYQINFDGYVGTMLRNSGYIIDLEYSRINYLIFKIRKAILDRI